MRAEPVHETQGHPMRVGPDGAQRPSGAERGRGERPHQGQGRERQGGERQGQPRPGQERPGHQRDGRGPVRPALRPTRPATLVVAALTAAALGWLGISRYFGGLPSLNWLPGLTLAGLAVVEAVLARTTRARIEGRPRSGQVNPLLVARYAVLAKASSLAGAIFAGAYGGVAAWAIAGHGRLRAADENLLPAVAGLVGALGLVAAGLLLEYACRVPPSDDHHHEVPGDAANGHL
jgi:uncharacterized protein DUF3180